MGQDDSCAICGKHYQSCSHNLSKGHLLSKDRNKTMCGRNPKNLIIETKERWLHADIDPFDLCKICMKKVTPFNRLEL